jgi:phosphohistidine phosphatase
VRHGDAVSVDVDRRRPLSKRGRDGVVELARLAIAREVRVKEICHSGILRAQETAEILADYLEPPQGVRSIAGLLPDGDPEIGKTELELADEPLMWVGHLPYMGRLAMALLKGGELPSAIEFSPATMICCSRAGTRWQLHWHISPQPS